MAEVNDNVRIYRDKAADYVPIVAFNIGDIPSERAAAYLAEKGFCLRAGYHCAALAHASLGTKGGIVRFAPSVFSTQQDVLRLTEVINNMK